MKLAGVCSNSVSCVYDALKKRNLSVSVLKSKIKDTSFILCPSYNTFERHYDELSKSKSTILLFDNVLFLTELECPILDVKVERFRSWASIPLVIDEINVQDKDYTSVMEHLPNFVQNRPKGRVARELFYLLDCTNIGANRSEFLNLLYMSWFNGKSKIPYKKYIKTPFDKKLFNKFFSFIDSIPNFVNNCKQIYDLKSKGKAINYEKFGDKLYPASFVKWLFNDYKILNTKIVHFGEDKDGDSDSE